MRRLLILGAGGHGRAVAEAVFLGRHYKSIAFLDDASEQSEKIRDIPVWGPMRELHSYVGRVDAAFVAIGRNAIREALHADIAAAGLPLATVIHPRSIVATSALVSPGCAVMAGAIIGPQAWLGEGSIVNSGAVVDHDCRVEAFGHLGVGACMSGSSVLGHGAWMQAGSALGYGVEVVAGRVLGPGEGIVA